MKIWNLAGFHTAKFNYRGQHICTPLNSGQAAIFVLQRTFYILSILWFIQAVLHLLCGVYLFLNMEGIKRNITGVF